MSKRVPSCYLGTYLVCKFGMVLPTVMTPISGYVRNRTHYGDCEDIIWPALLFGQLARRSLAINEVTVEGMLIANVCGLL